MYYSKQKDNEKELWIEIFKVCPVSLIHLAGNLVRMS